MSPFRMGVVGVGSMGYNHARVCAELPEVELVAVVDSNENVAQSVAEKFSAQYYTNPQELLGRVDGVAIVTPTAFHYDSSKLFMENGVHVLVEKPITIAAPEAKELVEIAKAKNLVLQVGHLERFNPAIVKLREMVRCPIMLEAHRLSAMTNRNLDVGISWDLMIHDYDIMLNLMQEEVVDICAQGTSVYSDYEDIASVQLRFQSGAIAHLVASRNSAERSRGLKVTERDGRVLLVDFIEQTLQVSTIGQDGRPTPFENIPIAKAEPLKEELAHFAYCATEHQTPLVSGTDGLRALELAIRVRAKMNIVKLNAR
ncbi:MAG: Gfo/Idh/MocA family oxidoreductase [bacterium]|nr:Gfo/Idh/MocA family oxidoreductase [bacterium]